MIRAAVFGSRGRMGRLLAEGSFDGVEFIQGIDSGDDLTLDPRVQVVVDFSLPCAWNDLNSLLRGNTVPLVSGTTGLGQGEMDLLHRWAEERPVFYSSNMSVGVFVLNRIVERAEELLDGSWDRELIEFHHRGKIDKPSGTAKKLMENWPGNSPSHSIRGGDLAGEHQLHYMGTGERLVLTHSASSRGVFAAGAARAVVFIAGMGSPGLYGMEDMLG
ncbi:MAG TPA: dihydrodipicolinate reductase C-terminal domain-containing protein [Candidatus Sabulitectum sp.]|nr:dihydrodipicolinate reductase C-terminal domain-containing protein [Candidatus Sabulitectum sp.]HPF33613.1 dihydrodipicolinate reductase C-terminal domain-containing protein [Candidatus Sabulitectum sp.]HPJ28438.1 dihydrodipicolinate reductase C-terminal domain-containing protein [Candidatus Sabulitectum sp.]HPR22024.1 dihydrodipicolinate reductase C-terminal domain-containing protein [Candidatus Sabulitectum sp.]